MRRKRWLPAAVVAVATLVWTGCYENEGPEESPSEVAHGLHEAGTEVTVSGEIARRYDDHTFSLGDDEWGENLIVVSRKPLPSDLEDDAVLRVRGTVHKHALVEFEREYSWDFTPEIESELEGVDYFLFVDSYEIVGAEG